MGATLGGMDARHRGVAGGRGVGPIIHADLGLVSFLLQVQTLGRLAVFSGGIGCALVRGGKEVGRVK